MQSLINLMQQKILLRIYLTESADTIRSIINNAIDIANGAIGLINDAISGVESAFTFGPWDVPTPFGDVTIGYEASFQEFRLSLILHQEQ